MIRIRELRKEKKLSMKELGDTIGVAESTISLYERGLREPDFNTLSILADYFHVTIDYLLGRTDDPHPMPNTNITPERAKELLRKPQNPDVVLISVQGSNGESETIEMPKKEFDDLLELKRVLHRQMLKHLED